MYKKYNIFIAVLISIHATASANAIECHGATYYNAEHALCMDCPPGFDADITNGKTDISQCKITCPGGYYLAPSEKYTALDYILFDNRPDSNQAQTNMYTRHQIFDTGIYLTGNDTLRAVFHPLSETMMAIMGQYYGPTSFQLYNNTFRYGEQLLRYTIPINQTHDISLGAGGLIIDGSKVQDTKYKEFTNTRSCMIGTIGTWDSTYYGKTYAAYIYNGDTLKHWYIPVRRIQDNSIGFYDSITDKFLENIGSVPATFGSESPFYICTPVGVGYWTPSQTLNYGQSSIRYKCPVGQTTIGYGAGADEAGDCGHIIHISKNAAIYLRSDKKTSPSLHAQINGKTFYGNMIPRSDIGKLRTQIGNTIYSIIDDTTTIQ